MSKLDALEQILKRINPEVKLIKFEKGYTNEPLSGYVFLAVDSIELRKSICEENQFNKMITAMFDFRMRLTDAQHYAADWSNLKEAKNLLNSMQFTSEEAKAETPTNACGTTLSVAPTVWTIVSLGVANFISFVRTNKLNKLVVVDAFNYNLDAF